jgi:hypothetical protein
VTCDGNANWTCIDKTSAKIDVAPLQSNEFGGPKVGKCLFFRLQYSVDIWVLSILESDSEIVQS